MPDMWLDVDTAVTVPVNLLPLIDDSDFKSIEIDIVYNQAGMDLVWHFVTSAGVITATAVTPTTAGDYDWTEDLADKGTYKVEIPATGGASINNDAEGYGWFTGVCTGVLPWRGPVIGFRSATLNDAMVDSGDLIAATADQVWDEAYADHVTAGTFGRANNIGHDGTAQAGASKSITLAAGASAVNQYYIDDLVLLTGGTGAGQARRIRSYAGSTRIASVHTAWGTQPVSGTTYVILPGGKTAAADTPAGVVDTTIATLASQTSFTLTNGSADDDAYNDCLCVVEDATTAYQVCVGRVSDYTGASKTVTLETDPGVFTMAVGDRVQMVIRPHNVTAAEANRIADHTIRRTFENACDSSDGDTKTFRSLLGAIGKLVNKIAVATGTLTVYEDDDTTSLGTQAVTTNAAADPITALDTT